MKKFQYKMESVLQIKIKLEEQAKIHYGNARMRLNLEEEKLEQLNQRKAVYENELKSLRMNRLNLLDIKMCEQAVDIINTNIKQQMIAIRNAEHRLEVARIRLNDAMVDRKTQDKLKEKAFEEYLLEFDSEERKEVDERNSFSYNKPSFHEEEE